jgi:hypothetical protein
MRKIWKSKPVWTIDPNPANLSEWNPPDILLSDLDAAGFRDLDGKMFVGTPKALIYRFPWYLGFMRYWYGFKHWLKHSEWPSRVLYFSGKHKLDKQIYLEVVKHPQDFLSY